MAEELTVKCDNVSKSFGGVHALAGVSLSFRPSGITAIIGPNGAGKTTLLNVLSGFLRADSGRHFLGHRETTCLPPHKIARLGLTRTFQNLRLITLVSVLENVMLARPKQSGEKLFYALTRIGVAAEEAANMQRSMEILEFVGLREQVNDTAGELSYGQQKLLTLAICLATESPILFLDEPVAGVNPEMIQKILGLLKQLRDEGKTIIFIEHDIEAVRQIADTVIVMDEGKVIAHGSPHEVLDWPEIMEAYLA